MGVPVDGKFKKFDAQVAFDPKQPAAAKIAFTVDLASVSFGSAETEAEVAKPDWFNTKAFPQATFQSSSVKATGPGKFEVAGTLAIKGASQNVVVPVTRDPGRWHHHRQRRLRHQAPRFQDRRRRLERHLDGRQRSASEVQARADRRGPPLTSPTLHNGNTP